MKIAIIGGGAAGTVAAISAAREGGQVTIYEQNDKLGRKILATGNGRCNFSNMSLEYPDNTNIRDYYHGSNPEFALSVLERFSLQDTIRFFVELGIYGKNQNGYLYPYSDQAASVSSALSHEVKRLGINVLYQARVCRISRRDNSFVIEDKTENGIRKNNYDRVIIAAGSKANPKSGSDGNGYDLCRALGLNVLKPIPCLTYLRSNAKWLKDTSGVRFDDVEVHIMTQGREGETKIKERGNIQFTDKGISGIVVFQLSSHVGRVLEDGGNAVAYIDFMPEMDRKELFGFITDRMNAAFDKDCYEALIGLFPAKLIPVILKESNIPSSRSALSLSEKEKRSMVESIKNLQVPVTGTGDFEHAQTCSGGVLTKQLDENLEVKSIPGLYLAGEILDIDGICGGYNLQFAWSSGWIAGKSASY